MARKSTSFPTTSQRRSTGRCWRKKYGSITGCRVQLAFLHVNLLDNRSEFLAPIRLRVFHEDDYFVIEAFGAVAVANSIAYISELLDPISIVLGLTRRTLMKQSLQYLIFWGRRNRIAGLLHPGSLLGVGEADDRTPAAVAGQRIGVSRST